MIMKISALLLSVPQSESRKEVEFHSDRHSVINLPARYPASPAYDVVAILDPTTRAAQKYTPLLIVLQTATNANIRIFFNCREKLSEMPLKRWGCVSCCFNAQNYIHLTSQHHLLIDLFVKAPPID